MWVCMIVQKRCVDRNVGLCMVGEEEGCPPSYQPCQSFRWCEMSANVKTDRGCIGSSGNVRKGRLARGLSWWNMGKLVFSGEWLIYVKSLQLSMWSSSWFSLWLPVSNQSIKSINQSIYFLSSKRCKILKNFHTYLKFANHFIIWNANQKPSHPVHPS
jgi:hypothetical protein